MFSSSLLVAVVGVVVAVVVAVAAAVAVIVGVLLRMSSNMLSGSFGISINLNGVHPFIFTVAFNLAGGAIT